MREDFLVAIRSLSRRPGFAALAIVPLAIGIGLTTAVFSIANALLIRPLPFPDGERLMWLQSTQTDSGAPSEFQVSAPDYDDWRRECRSWESFGAAMPFAFNVTGARRPQRIQGARATASLFSTLRVRPAAGRFFSEAEERGDAPVAVLSDEFWTAELGRSRTVLGRPISLDGRPYLVVGVLPRGFRFGPKADVLVPFQPRAAEKKRDVRGLNVVGRPRAGVSARAAAEELRALGAALAREHPDADRGWGVSVRPLRDVLVENVRSAVWILFAAAGFLFLVSCVNVSNLLLARAAGRRGEAAVRAALGAGRAAILRTFLAESLALSIAAGALGLAVAWAGLKPLLAACPVELTSAGPVGIDLRVAAFTLLAALLSALLCGSAAAWEGSRADLAAVLNASSRTAAGSRGARRLQGTLVAVEIAAVLLLSVGSGVAFAAFLRLRRVGPGFDPDGAATVAVALPDERYPDLASRTAFVRRVREELAGIPGVVSVGTTTKLPLDEFYVLTAFLPEGSAPPPDGDWWMAQFRRISPGYFASMGIPLAEGRDFSDDDGDGKPPVAIVSRALARRFWPGRSAVGMRLHRNATKGAWLTVVGVAGDVHETGLAAEPPVTLYIPYAQGKAALPDVAIVVRAATPFSSLARPVRERVASVDRELPVGDVRPLSAVVADSLVRQRFQMLLMGILAGAGIVLAAVGMFGLIDYLVSQQTRELAVRLALGATAGGVSLFVARRGARLTAAGLAAGIAGVAACGGVLRGVLPGTPAPGAGLVSSSAAALGALCVGASWLAARRAAAIAPAAALAEGSVG